MMDAERMANLSCCSYRKKSRGDGCDTTYKSPSTLTGACSIHIIYLSIYIKKISHRHPEHKRKKEKEKNLSAPVSLLLLRVWESAGQTTNRPAVASSSFPASSAD